MSRVPRILPLSLLLMRRSLPPPSGIPAFPSARHRDTPRPMNNYSDILVPTVDTVRIVSATSTASATLQDLLLRLDACLRLANSPPSVHGEHVSELAFLLVFISLLRKGWRSVHTSSMLPTAHAILRTPASSQSPDCKPTHGPCTTESLDPVVYSSQSDGCATRQSACGSTPHRISAVASGSMRRKNLHKESNVIEVPLSEVLSTLALASSNRKQYLQWLWKRFLPALRGSKDDTLEILVTGVSMDANHSTSPGEILARM